jgi:Tfp pilus assembly protein PilV
MLRRNKNLKGMTLMELLIASAIFIIGLGAMISASIALLGATNFSKSYLLATQLAREGIEVVKNIRDENFVNNRPFDDGMTLVNRAIIKFPAGGLSTGKLIIANDDHPTIDDCINDTVNKTCQLYFSTTDNTYGDASGGGAPTNIYRLLTFETITCTGDLANQNLCLDLETIGKNIKSEVKWYEGDRPYSVVITEALYNWK